MDRKNLSEELDFFVKTKLAQYVKQAKKATNLDSKALSETGFIGQVLKGFMIEVGHNPDKYRKIEELEKLIADVSLGLVAFMRSSIKGDFLDI